MLNKSRMVLMIIGLVSIIVLAGCSDEVEEQNKSLQENVTKLRLTNTQLVNNLQSIKSENISLKKEFKELRGNNKELDVALAKSELVFSQKYKEKLGKEQEKLDKEREAFKKKKEEIEQEAYVKANQSALEKYMIIIVALIIIFATILIFGYLKLKEYKKEIGGLKSSKKSLEEDQKQSEKAMQVLSKEIDKLKQQQQSGSLSKVVNKIEEHEAKRAQMLKRIEEK